MELTLMIKGDASVIAMVLAALPNGVAVTNQAIPATATAAPGMNTPVMVPPMPSNGGGDEDDEGAPPNTAAPALDAAGFPWDERIHAGTKNTKGDGTWKRKKSVDDALVASVEAEYRARGFTDPRLAGAAPAPVIPPMPVPTPAMQPPPVATPAVPMMPPVVPPMPAPVVAQPAAPVVPPMPVPPPAPAPMVAAVGQAMGVPAPAPAPAADGIDFQTFMQHLATKMAERDAAGVPLVHADYLASLAAEISNAFAPHGVAPLTSFTDIQTNPAMINYAVQLLQRDGKW